jgi:hypothetical protein
MAYDARHSDILRQDLVGLKGVTPKRMFGGLCFLLNGNMLCGVHKDGGMARVGKDHEAAALELDGVDPLSFTGRKMGGLVELTEAALRDDEVRGAVLELAKDFVGSMPAK